MNDQQLVEKWNAFVWCMTDAKFSSLNERDRALYLVFWYQSEVNNGGHFQYFLNRSATDPAHETAAALRAMQVDPMAKVLEDATALWQAKERQSMETVEHYINEAHEGEFKLLDLRFAAIEKDLHLALEAAVVNDLPLRRSE